MPRATIHRIHALAAKTASVVHARDLREAGISRNVVRRQVDAGAMANITSLTYGVGPMCTSPTHEMRCMAGTLHGGNGAALDLTTAAAALGAWNRPVDAIHVATVGNAGDCRSAGIALHRVMGNIDAPDIVHVGPVPVLSGASLCARLASVQSEYELAYVIDQLRYRELLDVAEPIDERERRSAARCELLLG